MALTAAAQTLMKADSIYFIHKVVSTPFTK
jgi:hypothetical protein